MTKIKHIDPNKLFKAEKFFNYFKINGKYYFQSVKDGKPTFVEISKKQVDEHLKRSKELAEKLKDSLDAEKVLTEVFMSRYDKEQLDNLYKTVFKSKKRYKPKTREGCCVDMKVGNHIIPIID